MKVIFLNIDGVLTCDETPNTRKFPYVVARKLLARLTTLVGGTGGNVVLTATWRLVPIGLSEAGHGGAPSIEATPLLPKRPRRDEVLDWLKKHPKVSRFALID